MADATEIEAERNARATRGKLLAAGGLLGALAASSCCILPLVLITLGVSGAWIGNLTALAPYQWVFVAITIACLVTGFYLVYGKSQTACTDERVCVRPLSGRLLKIVLWVATALVVSAIAFPFVAPAVLGP